MVVSRSWTYAPGYIDLTLSGASAYHGVTLDSKLTFETHFWEVVQKAARSLGNVRRE